jgi:hypothetical protein
MKGAAAMLRAPMVSATQQSFRIRRRKARTAGTRRKRDERAHGTPAFAIHPVGYDAKAADAKPVAAPAAPAPAKKAPKKPKPAKAASAAAAPKKS